MPTFGSLFAGIGGIDLGLERAGWTGRWQVEWDEFCQRVLTKHWPDIPRYGDITTVDWSGVEPVDLIAGGFPCQPVSLAGRQLAQDDERWLWPEFARAIRCIRPRVVLVENVPGLLVRGMGDVQRDLAELGYRRGWGVLSAADVGAPHLRRRVWIVAHADGDEHEGRAFTKWWTTAQDLFANPLGPDLWEQSVTFEWSSGPPIAGDDGPTWAVADTEGVGWRTRRTGRPVGDRPGQAERPLGAMAHADGRRRGQRDAGQRGLPVADSIGPTVADPASLRPPRSGESVEPLDPATDRDGQASQPRHGGWWRTEPDVGRVAHGVPSRVDRLRSLGNAVVPQVVEVIGRRLLEIA